MNMFNFIFQLSFARIFPLMMKYPVCDMYKLHSCVNTCNVCLFQSSACDTDLEENNLHLILETSCDDTTVYARHDAPKTSPTKPSVVTTNPSTPSTSQSSSDHTTPLKRLNMPSPKQTPTSTKILAMQSPSCKQSPRRIQTVLLDSPKQTKNIESGE